MIIEQIAYKCSNCDSEAIVKNGRNRFKNQQYLCKNCGTCRVLKPQKKQVQAKR